MKHLELRPFPFFILIYPIPFLCIFLTVSKKKPTAPEGVDGFYDRPMTVFFTKKLVKSIQICII